MSVQTKKQSARGPRITGWYEDVSIYTAIYNWLLPPLALNKVFNFHDYVELGAGKVRGARRLRVGVGSCVLATCVCSVLVATGVLIMTCCCSILYELAY